MIKYKQITIAIAVVDLFLAMVLSYMLITLALNISALRANLPNTFTTIFTYFTTNSLLFFTIEISVLLVLTIVFAIGLLKEKKWAIVPRMILAIIIVLYSIYNLITGAGSISIYTIYELLVAGFFGFMIISKKKFY